MSLPSPHRLQHLDVLRGVAALMVCFCHFKYGFAPSLRAVFSPMGDIGVFVFFVISGYIIPRAMSKEGYGLAMFGRFVVKRVARLHPPYLVALALTLALSLATAWWKHEAASWSAGDLPAFFFYAQAPEENPVFWTLQVEMCFYLFLGVAFPLLNSANAGVRWLTFLVPGIIWALGVDALFVRYISFFLIGIALEQYQRRTIGAREAGLKLAVAASIAWMQTGAGGMLIGLVAAALIARPPRLTWPRPVLWLGAISYSLYLVHFPIGVKFLNLTLDRLPGVPSELLALAALGISTTAAWMLYWAVERPAVRLSRAIDSRRESSPLVIEGAPRR